MDPAIFNSTGAISDDTIVPATGLRRRWTRLAGDADNGKVELVTQSGMRLPGRLLDESFGGIGVRVDEQGDLANGECVDAVYFGVPARAVVRHLTPLADGGVRVGLQWKD
jgi:hypothetical protein